jgi:hypothetical protein
MRQLLNSTAWTQPLWAPEGDGAPPATPPATPPADGDAAKPEDGAPPQADWRKLIAGDNADAAKALSRFTDPGSFYKAFDEAQKTIRQGGHKGAPPPRPADTETEALAKWREQMGLPPDPTGYKLDDKVAKRLTDDDKPLVSQFLDLAHKRDMTPAEVSKAMDAYLDMQEEVLGGLKQEDEAAREATEDLLRKEWGSDFRANKKFADEAAARLGVPGWAAARLPDGRILGNIPEMVKALAAYGRETIGDLALDGSNIKASEDRLKEIRGLFNDPKYGTDREFTKQIDDEYKTLLRDTRKASA